MELVEPAQRPLHLARARVGLGDEHHERVHWVAARAHQQLDRVVEARRIATLGPDHRLQRVDRLAPERRREGRLAGAHGVAVAPECVDLAVVGEQPERLRQRPARAGVGRVALVEDRDRRLVVRRPQVGEESGELRPREQRLVHERAAGERAHEERLELGSGLGDAPFDRAACEVERPLPGGRVGAPAVRGCGDDALPDGGAGDPCAGAEHVAVDGDIAPAEDREARFPQHRLDDGSGASQRSVVGRQEEGAEGEGLAGLEREPAARPIAVEQPGGNLREHAGAVARAVGRGGATVGHAGQGLERQGEDVGAALARGPRHEPHTAGVLFAPGVEIRRAAVGPPRSVAVGHACSSLDDQKEGPLSVGSGPGSFSLDCTSMPPGRSRSKDWSDSAAWR